MIPKNNNEIHTDRVILFNKQTPDGKHTSPTKEETPSSEIDTIKKDFIPAQVVINLPSKEDAKSELVNYYKNEILVGIIVGFVLVPQECAYAFIGNLDASLGTHACWIVGLVCAIFGGRPGMINGLTGGLASIVATFVTNKKGPSGSGAGVEQFFISTIIAGVIIIVVGLLKLGKFQIMIPATVKVGFCNGLAIIIAKGQTYAFYDEHKKPLEGIQLGIMIIYILITAIIFDRFPKLKCRCAKVIPSALICIGFIIFLEFGVVRNCGYHTLTLKDVAPFTSANAYPKPFFINEFYDMTDLANSASPIIVNGIMIGFMAILETTMTKEVVNEYTNTEGDLNRQFLALGASNIIAGFLGASVGGAMLGISTINMVNGGKGRVSSFVAALLVMIIMFGAYPLLNYIPLGVLVGMLFVVVYRTFKWFTLTAIFAELVPDKYRAKLKIQQSRIEIFELATIIVVTVLTVVVNLLIASVVGIIIAGMIFAYKNSQHLTVKSEIRDKGNKKVKVYIVEGPVYYATKKTFFRFFDVNNDLQYVNIDFDNDLFMDYTFIEALNKLCKKYKDSGREIKVKKLRRTALQTVEKFHKFVNNIEFIEEKMEIPGVPHFIEHNPLNQAPHKKSEDFEIQATAERFQNLEHPEKQKRMSIPLGVFTENNDVPSEQQTDNNENS